MGIFSRSGQNDGSTGPLHADVAPAPPVFSRSPDHILKGQNPSRRGINRRASFSGAVSRRKPLPQYRAASFTCRPNSSRFVIPPHIQIGGDKTKEIKPKRNGSIVSNESSYYEEIVDDTSYEEEIIEEEYYEEEYYEEEIVELPKREITINFHELDDIQMALHINDYTDSEIEHSWYSRPDYDKMVTKARQEVAKVEERARDTKLSKRSFESHSDDETAVEETTRSSENRGLEAWSTSGQVEIRRARESALEAVWTEQKRQWHSGEYEPEKIREAYRNITASAQQAAELRGREDQKIVELLRMKEEEEEKRKRKLLGKSKALIRDSMRVTTDGAKMTGKLLGKTGKVALTVGKKVTRTAVATATLDRRMLLEEMRISKSTNDLKPKTVRQPSLCSRQLKMKSGDLNSPQRNQSWDTRSEDSQSVGDLSMNTTDTNKRERLKLLGLVPIPGTKKVYKDDIRQRKIEDRRMKMSRRPSWEAGLSLGKY